MATDTMDMKDMVAALASMPDEQRKTMMRERLTMFAEMPDSKRREAMRQMMEAVGTLDAGQMKQLLKTRLEVLFELPETTRMTLMQTHLALLQSMPPERMQMEMKLTEGLLPELAPAVRRGVEQMMMSMMPAAGTTAKAPSRPTVPVGMPGRTARSAWDQAADGERLAGWGAFLFWVNAVLGGWLIIAPWVLDFDDRSSALWTTLLLGAAAGGLSLVVALARPGSWGVPLQWLTAVLGVAILISSAIVEFGNDAWVNNLIVGAAIALLAAIVAREQPFAASTS